MKRAILKSVFSLIILLLIAAFVYLFFIAGPVYLLGRFSTLVAWICAILLAVAAMTILSNPLRRTMLWSYLADLLILATWAAAIQLFFTRGPSSFLGSYAPWVYWACLGIIAIAVLVTIIRWIVHAVRWSKHKFDTPDARPYADVNKKDFSQSYVAGAALQDAEGKTGGIGQIPVGAAALAALDAAEASAAGEDAGIGMSAWADDEGLELEDAAMDIAPAENTVSTVDAAAAATGAAGAAATAVTPAIAVAPAPVENADPAVDAAAAAADAAVPVGAAAADAAGAASVVATPASAAVTDFATAGAAADFDAVGISAADLDLDIDDAAAAESEPAGDASGRAAAAASASEVTPAAGTPVATHTDAGVEAPVAAAALTAATTAIPPATTAAAATTPATATPATPTTSNKATAFAEALSPSDSDEYVDWDAWDDWDLCEELDEPLADGANVFIPAETLLDAFDRDQMRRYVAGAFMDGGYQVRKLKVSDKEKIGNKKGDAGTVGTAYDAILVKRGATRAIVVCLKQNTKLGKSVVDEVYQKSRRLNCNGAVIATTGPFSKGAKALAAERNVTLWGKQDLLDFL